MIFDESSARDMVLKLDSLGGQLGFFDGSGFRASDVCAL